MRLNSREDSVGGIMAGNRFFLLVTGTLTGGGGQGHLAAEVGKHLTILRGDDSVNRR